MNFTINQANKLYSIQKKDYENSIILKDNKLKEYKQKIAILKTKIKELHDEINFFKEVKDIYENNQASFFTGFGGNDNYHASPSKNINNNDEENNNNDNLNINEEYNKNKSNNNDGKDVPIRSNK